MTHRAEVVGVVGVGLARPSPPPWPKSKTPETHHLPPSSGEGRGPAGGSVRVRSTRARLIGCKSPEVRLRLGGELRGKVVVVRAGCGFRFGPAGEDGRSGRWLGCSRVGTCRWVRLMGRYEMTVFNISSRTKSMHRPGRPVAGGLTWGFVLEVLGGLFRPLHLCVSSSSSSSSSEV